MSLWVFGYGSLLWNPEFDADEAVIARLEGYHRSFCMLSIHHRGSEEEPGLVLALDEQPGSACLGLALRLPEAGREAILIALRERELISSAYVEREVTLDLTDGRRVTALAYVIDPDHRQYVDLDLETQARMIARARGGRGKNDSYLFNTHDHLISLGIEDQDMDWLVARVRAIGATDEGAGS